MASSGADARGDTTTAPVLPPVPELGEAHSTTARARLKPRLVDALRSQGLELNEEIGEGLSWESSVGVDAEQNGDRNILAPMTWELISEVSFLHTALHFLRARPSHRARACTSS